MAANMAANAAHRIIRFNTIGVLGCAIAAAWAVCIWAELNGNAAQLHHHALYASGRPYWLAALVVLVAWQFMTAAMMLPSSLGLIRIYAATAGRAPDFPHALALFLGGYFAVWTAFALAAFTGDMQLHRIVDAWPWLAAHAALIPAGTLALAAVYQFTPLKDACLKACRHPGIYLMRYYRRGALERIAPWFRSRALLPGLLLGADAGNVCCRSRASGLDGRARNDNVRRESDAGGQSIRRAGRGRTRRACPHRTLGSRRDPGSVREVA